jgi:putative endonuclease
MQGGWVYILTNRPDGTLHVGVTTALPRRIREHREGSASVFTRSYGLKRLVYAEPHDSITSAIQRAKNLQHWSRA